MHVVGEVKNLDHCITESALDRSLTQNTKLVGFLLFVNMKKSFSAEIHIKKNIKYSVRLRIIVPNRTEPNYPIYAIRTLKKNSKPLPLLFCVFLIVIPFSVSVFS